LRRKGIVRRIGILAVLGSLAVLVLVVSSGTTQASPGSGFSAPWTYRATIDAHHFDSSDYKLYQKDSQDVVMRQIVYAAGGSSGWHSHPGPTYVVVESGTIRLYEAADPTCTPRTFGPGQGFVELPGDVHITRNETSQMAVALVTFMDVPVGGAFRIEAPVPGNCPF
jgi:quercetin dioxygenase-like cupin family protein